MKKLILISFIVSVSSMFGYADTLAALDKWKIDNEDVNSSTFELRSGQLAFYNGEVNRGDFRNFVFKARISHSDGVKASFWIHSDANFSKGYSVLIGNSTDDRRRSGSLSSVRNLYRPQSSSFDLEVRVEGKRILVSIDNQVVVDYLEPATKYRVVANAAQLLSSGLIGFCVENGTLNVVGADIVTLEDNIPSYPAGREPIDERNDAVIRLQQRNFPIVDYHVHLPRGMDIEDLLKKSLEDGFEYGMAVNCGIGFSISTDEQAMEYFLSNQNVPFYIAMQAEGREWVDTFSKETFDLFDYVFTDALTFYDHKGRRTLLWAAGTVIIDIPEQEYMDMILDRTLKVLNEEPINIWVNPTLLGDTMMADYDKYWTDERVAMIVKALRDNNIALEINARYKLPSARIIKAAKAAGVKFTLGTNNGNVQQLDRLEYSLKMVEECGLTIEDMWFPK
jgi:Histidinol phosphatase and related hydrolases of the PHP family